MRALVITGLFNIQGASYIENDLKKKGYQVDVHKWRSTNIDYSKDYDYVVAHSAGSIQAQAYARRHPNSIVYIMGAPMDTNLPNVIFVGQKYDPVAIIGGLGNVDRSSRGFVHSKDVYYDRIKAEIYTASRPVTTSRTHRMRTGDLRIGE